MIGQVRYKPLPDKLFLVRVPIICTYSQAELDLVGVPMTLDTNSGEFRDRKAYNNLTTCMLKLTKIIDIYCQGYPIYVVKHEDTLEIFNLLEDYLAGVVSTQSTYVLNTPTVIEERLPDIEKFAQEMFGLNKGDIVRGSINLSNQGMGGLGLDIMKPQPMATYKIEEDNQPIKITRPTKHTSYPLPKEEIVQQPTQLRKSIPTSNIGYVNHTLPEFNLDEVKRKPSYRKQFK